MNQNYIAPEALDENNNPTCPHCKKYFENIELKIKYYQGECPYCGQNPSALSITNSKIEQDRSTRNKIVFEPGNFTPISGYSSYYNKKIKPSKSSEAEPIADPDFFESLKTL
jgi:hypothetical protein